MKPWLLAGIVGALLNGLDAVLTVRGIEFGYLRETNPLLATVLCLSVPFFYMLQGGVSVLFLILGVKSDNVLARMGLTIGLIAYVTIGIYHLFGLTATLGGLH